MITTEVPMGCIEFTVVLCQRARKTTPPICSLHTAIFIVTNHILFWIWWLVACARGWRRNIPQVLNDDCSRPAMPSGRKGNLRRFHRLPKETTLRYTLLWGMRRPKLYCPKARPERRTSWSTCSPSKDDLLAPRTSTLKLIRGFIDAPSWEYDLPRQVKNWFQQRIKQTQVRWRSCEAFGLCLCQKWSWEGCE